MIRTLLKTAATTSILVLVSCSNNPTPPEETDKPAVSETPVPAIAYNIVGRLPHDSNSFTEGLLWHKGQLYESTGSPDNLPQTLSILGPVDLKTGRINMKASLGRAYFGEGISFFDQ